MNKEQTQYCKKVFQEMIDQKLIDPHESFEDYLTIPVKPFNPDTPGGTDKIEGIIEAIDACMEHPGSNVVFSYEVTNDFKSWGIHGDYSDLVWLRSALQDKLDEIDSILDDAMENLSFQRGLTVYE